MNARLKQIRAEAGRKGGQQTLTKYGRGYFQDIGKKGAASLHRTYQLKPAELNDFALVHRVTGEVRAYLSGKRAK